MLGAVTAFYADLQPLPPDNMVRSVVAAWPLQAASTFWEVWTQYNATTERSPLVEVDATYTTVPGVGPVAALGVWDWSPDNRRAPLRKHAARSCSSWGKGPACGLHQDQAAPAAACMWRMPQPRQPAQPGLLRGQDRHPGLDRRLGGHGGRSRRPRDGHNRPLPGARAARLPGRACAGVQLPHVPALGVPGYHRCCDGAGV